MRTFLLIVTIAGATALCVSGQETRSTMAPASQSQPPPDEIAKILDRLDRLNTAVDSLKSQSFIRDWGTIIAALVAAGVATYSLRKNTEMARRALEEKAREEERKAIRTQIDEFYAPFLQLRNSSKYLYQNAFVPRRTPEEKTKYSNAQGFFRTLPALVDGHKFTGPDLAILREIVSIGTKTKELILSKSGLIAENNVQAVLARATAHFRVMELLVDGDTLVGGGKEFDQFTFPHEVDELVQKKLNALNARLNLLQEQAAA